jgi:hypothetical protein
MGLQRELHNCTSKGNKDLKDKLNMPSFRDTAEAQMLPINLLYAAYF